MVTLGMLKGIAITSVIAFVLILILFACTSKDDDDRRY
jgi:hypothetical protein